eukprot:s131_g21.t1
MRRAINKRALETDCTVDLDEEGVLQGLNDKEKHGFHHDDMMCTCMHDKSCALDGSLGGCLLAMADGSPSESNGRRCEEVKMLLIDIIENEEWLGERRKLLRLRAGISENEKRKVPKFQFIITDRDTIAAREVESDHNYELILEYLVSFAHDVPSAGDVKVALAWASQHYKLNPWSELKKHQEWAETEGGLIRACAAYCLDRFQRYSKSRSGHERMDMLRGAIHEKLKAEGLLSPDGKKIPTRGRGALRVKQQQAAQRAVLMDSVDTQPMDDSMSPITRMASLSLNSPQPEKVIAPETQPGSGDKNDLQEESAEEEEMTSDEEVEMLPKVAVHSDICIDIISEEESILSRQKASPADLCAEGAGSDGNHGGEPRVNAASTKGTPGEALVKDCSQRAPTSTNQVEEILDSDDGDETTRGVFKDRKPLVPEAGIPQSLRDQADAQIKALGGATAEENEAEMVKAQNALRQMQKEAEDPDRALQDELQQEAEAVEQVDEEEPKDEEHSIKPAQQTAKDASCSVGAETLHHPCDPADPSQKDGPSMDQKPRSLVRRRSSRKLKRLKQMSPSPSAKKKPRQEAGDSTIAGKEIESAEVTDSQAQGEIRLEDSQPVTSLDLTSPPAKIPRRRKKRKVQQAGSKATSGKDVDAVPSAIPSDGWTDDTPQEEPEMDVREDEARRDETEHDEGNNGSKGDPNPDEDDKRKEKEQAAKDPTKMCKTIAFRNKSTCAMKKQQICTLF